MVSHTVSDLLNRIRSEYIEMPGLRLTSLQARRLWNLEALACDDVLATLVHEGFLNRTTEGAYLRPGGEPRAWHLNGIGARSISGDY